MHLSNNSTSASAYFARFQPLLNSGKNSIWATEMLESASRRQTSPPPRLLIRTMPTRMLMVVSFWCLGKTPPPEPGAAEVQERGPRRAALPRAPAPSIPRSGSRDR